MNNTKQQETNNTLNAFYYYKAEQLTVLAVLFAVIVIGNLGVIYTSIWERPRKSRMNFFIAHLAFADLLVGLVSVLTDIIWRITIDWYAGNFACKLIKFLQVVVTYASTYVLVALSIDRYDAIRHPMKFSGSWKRAKFLIISAWLMSILISTPILVLFEEKLIQDRLQCWIELDLWLMRIYITMVWLTVFIIPVCIITTCYTIIIVTIWNKSNTLFQPVKKSTVNNRLGSDNSKRASSRGLIPRAKVKTVKITFVIVSVFVLCWSPYIVFDLLDVYGLIEQNQTNIAIATFIQSLAPLNSAANPIIYCIFSSHFCHTLMLIPPFKWIHKKKKTLNDITGNTQSSSVSECLTSSTNKKQMDDISLSQMH